MLHKSHSALLGGRLIAYVLWEGQLYHDSKGRRKLTQQIS